MDIILTAKTRVSSIRITGWSLSCRSYYCTSLLSLTVISVLFVKQCLIEETIGYISARRRMTDGTRGSAPSPQFGVA